MSAIAQFERDVISDRTREGLKSARARGRTGGRPKTDPDAVRKAIKLYHTQQYSIREIEEKTGVKNVKLCAATSNSGGNLTGSFAFSLAAFRVTYSLTIFCGSAVQ